MDSLVFFCFFVFQLFNSLMADPNALCKDTATLFSIPERLEVNLLFAPTGPIQEVSMSSGWSDIFLRAWGSRRTNDTTFGSRAFIALPAGNVK